MELFLRTNPPPIGPGRFLPAMTELPYYTNAGVPIVGPRWWMEMLGSQREDSELVEPPIGMVVTHWRAEVLLVHIQPGVYLPLPWRGNRYVRSLEGEQLGLSLQRVLEFIELVDIENNEGSGGAEFYRLRSEMFLDFGPA